MPITETAAPIATVTRDAGVTTLSFAQANDAAMALQIHVKATELRTLLVSLERRAGRCNVVNMLDNDAQALAELTRRVVATHAYLDAARFAASYFPTDVLGALLSDPLVAVLIDVPVSADVEPTECEGHESLGGGDMGQSVFCDGSCTR